MRMKIFLVAVFFMMFLAMPPLSKGYIITTSLRINDTSSTVHIPGEVEKSTAVQQSGAYATPDSFYVASYRNNILKGLVFNGDLAYSIGFTSGSNYHYINLSQDLSNSRVFLTFSRGDWNNIENRMETINRGEFLQKISPTFGYSLGLKYKNQIILTYSDIDIQGNLILGKGLHTVSIESNRTSSGKKIVVSRDLT